MTRIKICGITRKEDALFCDSAGADFLGFIFVKESPRFIKNPDEFRTLETKAKKVAVIMNQDFSPSEFKGFDFIQFHGLEDKDKIIKAKENGFGVIKTIFPEMPESSKLCEKLAEFIDYFLVDSSSKLKAKSGKFDEKKLSSIIFQNKIFGKDFFLSGGLTPENVSIYIKKFNPFGVDVSSGVESSPGIKSKEKVLKFIKNVKSKNLDDLPQ